MRSWGSRLTVELGLLEDLDLADVHVLEGVDALQDEEMVRMRRGEHQHTRLESYRAGSLDILADGLGLQLADNGLEVSGGHLVVDNLDDLSAHLAGL